MKKMLLFTSMALTALAFAVPASASAYVWTASYGSIENHELEEGQTAPETFEGYFGFDHGAYGSFWCEATIEIEAEAYSGGRIADFDRNPSNCWGTGQWKNVSLIEGSSNVAEGWGIDVSSTPEITSMTTGIVVSSKYLVGGMPVAGSQKFTLPLEVIPTLDGEGKITEFTLDGTETNGVVSGTFGVFWAPESPEYELGLK